MAKGSDPIQQIFLDKLSEFRKISQKPDFLDNNPDLKKRIGDEKNRLTGQFGAEKAADLEKFPDIKLQDPPIDPQPGF